MKGIPALAKALASDQMKIRKRAQFEVENILCSQTKDDTALPTYGEMLAICKGLHYTLWMQDKLLLKEEVVRRICHILPLIPHPTMRLHYINAMFETLAREWDRLDNWRLDKFMLVGFPFCQIISTRLLSSLLALHSLVPVDREVWNHVLEAVFDKILNADIQHAVGLKMHMCTVLSEELPKKKIKAFCVVLTLVHLVSRLVELPRHHAYAHNFLRVIHTLLSTLRRHSKNCSVEVSFSPSDCTVPVTLSSSQKESKKRRKTSQKGKTAHKKRRLMENSSEGEPSMVRNSSNNEIAQLPQCASKSEEISQTTDVPMSTSDPVNEHISKTPHQTTCSVSTPVDSVDKAKRRVSFGKVFRKRFIASQRLSMTPTAKTTPKKGIL
ncbi:nucleolar protein,Nop52, partial [Opisthorchis viverrini]